MSHLQSRPALSFIEQISLVISPAKNMILSIVLRFYEKVFKLRQKVNESLPLHKREGFEKVKNSTREGNGHVI